MAFRSPPRRRAGPDRRTGGVGKEFAGPSEIATFRPLMESKIESRPEPGILTRRDPARAESGVD